MNNGTGNAKLGVYNTCSWEDFAVGKQHGDAKVPTSSVGPGSQGPAPALAPIGQVSECSEGFTSCIHSSGMVSSQSSLLNLRWEF